MNSFPMPRYLLASFNLPVPPKPQVQGECVSGLLLRVYRSDYIRTLFFAPYIVTPTTQLRNLYALLFLLIFLFFILSHHFLSFYCAPSTANLSFPYFYPIGCADRIQSTLLAILYYSFIYCLFCVLVFRNSLCDYIFSKSMVNPLLPSGLTHHNSHTVRAPSSACSFPLSEALPSGRPSF